MNVRIKQLIEQSLIEKPVMTFNRVTGERFPKLYNGKQLYTNKVDMELFTKLLVTECVGILVNKEKTMDAIWDLEELGINISEILNTIQQ